MTKRHSAEPAQNFHGDGAQDADILVKRAKSQTLDDGGLRTSQILSEALAADPHNHEAQVLQERLHQMFVPRWHFPMLADTARNQAYAQAIAAKVRPGDVVLDIGCGAGLTAMLAARAGAKHVYTCEQQPLIAQAATRVIAENGLSDRITVIPKWSHEINVGTDIPERADVVISEIVDTVLLGEGALATLTHAMSALAKPNARAVPEWGTLKAQLVESNGLLDQWRPHQAEGFDLSAFHRFARVAQLTPGEFAACGLRSLGPAAELFQFDFTRPDLTPARTATDLTCAAAGTAHAVLVSFELQLAPGIHVTNGMDASGHWGRTAFLLDRAEIAAPGDRLTITAQHDTSHLSVSANGPLIPAGEAAAATVWLNPAWRLRRPVREGGDRTAPPPAVWSPADTGGAGHQGQSCH